MLLDDVWIDLERRVPNDLARLIDIVRDRILEERISGGDSQIGEPFAQAVGVRRQPNEGALPQDSPLPGVEE